MSEHNKNMEFILLGQKKKNRRFFTVIITLTLLSLIGAFLTIYLGNTIYSVETIIRVFSGGEVENATFSILTLRLPRMLAGLTAGFAFGFGGSVFQTMLRNPLANPNILGITSASSVGALICILLLNGGSTVIFFGSIIGATIVAVSIYMLSKFKRYSVGRLILIGIAFQAMMNSLISYLLLIGNENDLSSAVRWMSGSLNGVSLSSIFPLILVMIFCIPIIIAKAKDLEILELGEESAITLGINTNRTRGFLLIGAVVLVAVATATTGPISFVSFLAGPIAKRITGYGNSSPITAGIFGATLVLFSDLMGQNLFDTRFPVGVVTGLIGAPYLIYLLIRMNRHCEL
ncbi:MAG: FecCD family ABC transporter permease [Lachnospirales bacterium]